MALAGLLTACAYVPPKDAPLNRVSDDYMATGDIKDVRAFVYGDTTFLMFSSAPPFLVVRDEEGNMVSYERAGQYYRLARRLDTFTAWVNGDAITFVAPTVTKVFSAPVVKPAPAPAPIEPLHALGTPVVLKTEELAAVTAGDDEIRALLQLSQEQLADVRRSIEAARVNPRWTGKEIFTVNQRLDDIAARLTTESAAIAQVYFPSYCTTFKPDEMTAAVIVAAGRSADQVSIRGYTDSRIAGRLDPKIADSRAQSARDYLVAHGVDSAKIKISSKAAGGFIAPNFTKEGRALNRRVEIEFVSARISALQGQPAKLAQANGQQ
jgi:outer membrane protein OmpA-like peptidoglycan-associated protein